MNRAISWSAVHPRLALLLAAVLAVALGWGCRQLRLDGSTEQLFADRSGEFDDYEEFKANFGGDEWIAVVATGPELFTEESLVWLKRFASDLDASEDIRRVESIFHLSGYERRGRWLFPAPLIGTVPEDGSEGMERLREAVLRDARSRGRLASVSGEALCFLVELDSALAAQRGESKLVAEVLRRCDDAAAEAPGGIELFAVGVPLIHLEIKAATSRDLSKALPLSVLAIWLGLLPFLRGWTALVLLLATSLLAATATLGFIGWMGFPVTVVLYPAVVLVVVVTSAEDIYLMAEFREGLRAGLSREESLARLGPKLGFTVLMTAATSAMGFATLALTANLGMQRFALVGAVGIVFGLAFTVLVVPALLALLPPPKKAALRLPSSVRRIRRCVAQLAGGRRRQAGFACLAMLLVVSAGIPRIEIDTAFLDYLPKDSPLLRNVARFRETFGGLSYVSVVLETNEPGGVNRRETLHAMDRFQTFLETQGGAVHSYLDLLEEMARWFGGGEEETRAALPDQDNLDDLLAMVPHEFAREFIDHDGSRARFQLQVHAPSSRELIALEKSILAYPGDALPPNAEIQVAGSRVLVAHYSERVVRELLASLAALSLFVALLLGLVLRSARLGTVALIPNVLPILATLGLMGWIGIPLSLGTFYVGVIALGIAVNDTIHLLLRYRQRLASGRSRELALRTALHEKCVPVMATGLALAGGSSVLALSELSNIRDSGILLAFAMLAASAADLLLTPLLLGVGKAGPIGAVEGRRI